jgi:hypothetical protein
MGRLLDLANQWEAKQNRHGAIATTVVRLCGQADPKARLWDLLDTWAGMDETTWPEANVKALYDDIMDIFGEYPEADGWFREWRAAHPEARLC